MRRRLAGKLVLVTGASSGVGEALAREAAAQGAKVVLAARREERIRAIADELHQKGAETLAVRCDVTADGDLEAVVERAHSLGALDLLFANAGFAVQGALEALSLDDYRRQFETNVYGVLRSIYAALPDLKRTGGAIGVVGSANGYVSLPDWSAYCMSKHAVRALCDSIRHELRPLGVSVTHLALGFVESDIRRLDKLGRLRADLPDPVPSWLQMPARAAARRMLSAVVRRSAESVITGHAKVGVAVARHAPWLASTAVGASAEIVRRRSRRSPC